MEDKESWLNQKYFDECDLLVSRMNDMLNIYYPDKSLDPRVLCAVLINYSATAFKMHGGTKSTFMTVAEIVYDRAPQRK